MEANTVIAFATVASVVVAAIYAGLTYLVARKNGEMVALMEAQYREFIAPHVTLSVGIKHSVVTTIKIRNVGRSTAKNVRLSLDRDFYQFADHIPEKNVRNWPLFQRAMPCMGAGDEIFFMLCQGFNIDKEIGGVNITPSKFSILVAYEFGGVKRSEDYEIDLGFYSRTQQDRPQELEELEKIQKHLGKLVSVVGAR